VQFKLYKVLFVRNPTKFYSLKLMKHCEYDLLCMWCRVCMGRARRGTAHPVLCFKSPWHNQCSGPCNFDSFHIINCLKTSVQPTLRPRQCEKFSSHYWPVWFFLSFLGGREPNLITGDPRYWTGPLSTYLWWWIKRLSRWASLHARSKFILSQSQQINLFFFNSMTFRSFTTHLVIIFHFSSFIENPT